MTTILFPVFYRQHGARRLQSLLSPAPKPLSQLPSNSVLHFSSFDKEHLDLDTSKTYLGDNVRKAVIDFEQQLSYTEGSPRFHNTVLQNFTRDFLRTNRKFRHVHDPITSVTDSSALLVYNYSYLQKLYTYTPLPINSYNEWYNISRSMFKKINDLAKQNDKNHFVFCNVPKDIPSIGILNVFQDKNNVGMLKVFDTPEELLLLNMYRWLLRPESVEVKDTDLGVVNAEHDCIFKDLERSALPKINIVFTNPDGNSIVLNLGYFNSWVKGELNQTEFNTVEQVTASQLQKVFLKFMLGMRSLIVEPTEAEVFTDEVPEEPATTEDQDTDDDMLDSADDADLTSSLKQVDKPVEVIASLKDKDIDKAMVDTMDIDAQLATLDEDIKVLDDVSKRKMKERGVHIEKNGEVQIETTTPVELQLHEIQQKVYASSNAETVLREQVEAQVDYGLLSASDYRNFVRDIETFKTSKDPYGSGVSVLEAKEISTEVLQLNEEKTKIVASDIVQDKSMLQSSLQSFDHDYVNNVLKKDMLSMVYELQRSGIAIRKHSVEVEHSALGSYESHTLEFKPVDGQVSTVRFKVPVINEDGTFLANSNKTVMRKQRVDLPIRKIKPTEVALTSYYGKTFVKLNPKKSNSSLEWIVKELNIEGMSGEGFIKRVNPAKVFDNNFKAPFIYNALADNYKSIVTEKFTLTFDHTERSKMVNEVALTSLEKNGSRVVGLTNQRLPIVVDTKNHFSVANQNGELTPIGDIFEVLHLDAARAPVDFTEVNIFSKSIPVAFVLGYSLGFKNLLKLLQVKYRVTEGRQNKNLMPHEFAIQFKDYSYIFSRKDTVASMILAGFNDFDKQIKVYEAAEFDQKNVYLNLLESKGLSAIYMRELQLMQQLFVDPITRGILQQMNEPLTFNGLLIRSTEMLQTYHHPDSQDMSCMRIRGYERIPGAVYKEMMIAIRQYRNKNIAGRSKVDISPYQVWSSIIKDPAMKLVEDINPIQNLKETEIVTYAGEGGRGKDSMNKASRAYHENDMGIVSEATVDSSDVGVNAYLSANPKFKDLRGIPLIDKKAISASSLISTSALLAPGSDSDDIKRVKLVLNYISYFI